MLKTLLVLVVGLVAVAAAAANSAYDPIQVDSGVSYLREANFEAPLNCGGSPAASRALVGEQTCTELFSGGSSKEQRDLVWECACALVTHNIWYKSIANGSVKQLTRLADRAIISKLRDDKDLPQSDLVLINGFNDRVDYLQGLKWFERNPVIRDIQTKMSSKPQPPIGNVDYRGWWEKAFEEGRQRSEDVCKELAANRRWTGFIKPSLESIERSTFGGANLRHALVVTQPELDQLIGLANLCENIIFKELEIENKN